MEKLVREYEKNGLNVKIYAPIATENEKKAKRVEIKSKVINTIKKSRAKSR